jgi:hypothetical protein
MTYRELLRLIAAAPKSKEIRETPVRFEKEMAIVPIEERYQGSFNCIHEAHLEQGRLQYQEIRIEGYGILMSDPTGTEDWKDIGGKHLDLAKTVAFDERSDEAVPSQQLEEPYDNPL